MKSILPIFQFNITSSEVHPTEIRWNLYHMALFRSGIDLLATIIIPASLLAYWNFNTQRILKRRARIIFRSRASRNENLVNATNQQQAAQMLNNNDQNNDLEQESANNDVIAQNTVENQHAEGMIYNFLVNGLYGQSFLGGYYL